MPKAICVVALSLAVFLAALALTGCSGNEAKARQFIESAREKSQKVAENEVKLQQKGEELAKYNELFQNITPETAATLKGYFAQLVTLHEAINKAAQETRDEYKKILDLEGVADFRKYAQNRIDAINLIDRRSLLVKQFAAIYDQVVDQALNAQPIDETLVRNQTEQISLERQQIDKQLDDLNNKAADLAEKLKIE